MARQLPTGTVTFLFTDVEGSTRLWEEAPARAGAAMARHDAIIEEAVELCGGVVVRPRGEGDSRFCVFDRPTEAIAAALAIQLALHKEPWDLPRPIKVRIAVHTGEAELRANDYYGAAVNRCARLRGLGWGGQTLVSSVTEDLLGAAPGEGVTLRDLGPHRLRDMADPERVYQLCHPDLPDGFGPLRSVDAVRNNLPAEMTTFIGREQAVSEVKKLVADNRLVTVHGAAGCGKTRLALEVADEMIGTFPDGEWFVDLAPVSDPAVVAETVAGVLRLREGDRRLDGDGRVGQHDVRERVIEHLRSKHLLLVLDNCEHLIAASAGFAEQILRSCPRVRILATSREALGIDVEVAWRVPSLTTPQLGQEVSVEALSTFEACRLFVERARQRRPDFAVTEREAPAIAEICARLDGIPLAIELAAARAKVLTPAQIAERLNDFFRLLVGGSRTALERQQTLRAAVDWSHEPLDEIERALFRRLSVFVGGFGLESVEEVCAEPPLEAGSVLDVLTALVDKSMVELDVRSESTRYRMLETFRQYARQRLIEAGEANELRDRHRDHFLAMAERAGPELWGPRQLITADRLEVDHDNLRAALEWSLPDGSGAALRMLAALWPFWQMRGHHTEWRTWVDQILPAPGADPALTANAWVGASWLDLAHGNVVRTEERATFALEDARAAEHPRWTAIAIGSLTLARFLQGRDTPEDRALIAEAESIARAADDPLAIALCLSSRARTELSDGDPDAARRSWEQALGHARRAGTPIFIGMISLRLADMLHERENDLAASRLMAQTAYRVGDVQLRADALARLASIAIAEERLDDARALITEGTALIEEYGAGDYFMVSLRGILATIEGDLAEARRMFRRAHFESEERGVRPELIRSKVWLGRLDRLEGRPAEALDGFRRALATSVGVGLQLVQPIIIGLIGGSLATLGDAAGVELVSASERLLDAVGIQRPQIDQRLVADDLARVRAALDDASFERAWARGSALTQHEAVERALGHA